MPSVRDIRAAAGDDPITMLTAYDALTASLAEEAGIDVLLVGDSMGNAVLGNTSTLPVTLAETRSRTAAVARGTEEALVVADMPFLSFGHPTIGDDAVERKYGDDEYRRLTFKDGKLSGGVLVGNLAPQSAYKSLIREERPVADQTEVLLAESVDVEDIDAPAQQQ